MAAISSLSALFTSLCRASKFFFSNSGETMMALNAWPHPPDMSSISTWVALIFCRSVAESDSGVMLDDAATTVADVSLCAAMGKGDSRGPVADNHSERRDGVDDRRATSRAEGALRAASKAKRAGMDAAHVWLKTTPNTVVVEVAC